MKLTKEELEVIKGVGEEPGWIVGISSYLSLDKEKVKRILEKLKKLEITSEDDSGIWTLTEKGEEIYTERF